MGSHRGLTDQRSRRQRTSQDRNQSSHPPKTTRLDLIRPRTHTRPRRVRLHSPKSRTTRTLVVKRDRPLRAIQTPNQTNHPGKMTHPSRPRRRIQPPTVARHTLERRRNQHLPNRMTHRRVEIHNPPQQRPQRRRRHQVRLHPPPPALIHNSMRAHQVIHQIHTPKPPDSQRLPTVDQTATPPDVVENPLARLQGQTLVAVTLIRRQAQIPDHPGAVKLATRLRNPPGRNDGSPNMALTSLTSWHETPRDSPERACDARLRRFGSISQWFDRSDHRDGLIRSTNILAVLALLSLL